MDKIKLIDFLYGEMTEAEKSDFIVQMDQNPELLAEVISLQKTRKFFTEDAATSPGKVVKLKKTKLKLSYWMGMVASILLLMGVFKWTDFKIVKSEGKTMIGFGDLEEEYVDDSNQNDQIDSSYALVLEYLDQLQSRLDSHNLVLAQMNDNNKKLFTKITKFDDERLSHQDLQNAVFALSNNQKVYTNEMVTELLEYIEITRNEDLQKINEGINNLAILLYHNTEPESHIVYQTTQK